MNTTRMQFKITKKPKTISVEFSPAQFERVAAALGMFNPDFLKNLARSEADYRAGRVHTVKSLKEIL